MNEIVIREVGEEDFDSILDLQKQFAFFQKTPEKITITVEQMKEEQDFFRCLVAETKDKVIVGFATYFPVYFSWSGKAMYVDDLFVKDDFRNKGIGKQLLTAIINMAKENGCKKVRWQVSDWNENAIDFYKSLGAEINNTERNCDLVL